MSFNFKFPFTNMYTLNLDWILQKVKELAAQVVEFGETLEAEIAAIPGMIAAKVREIIAELVITAVYVQETETIIFKLSEEENNG